MPADDKNITQNITPRLPTGVPTPDEHECSAAAINSVLVRCTQNGRAYFTTEDARAAWAVRRVLMELQPAVGAGTRLSAPQTQAQAPQVAAFAAVEKALMSDLAVA